MAGAGYALKLPVIDISEVGAGGGSIVRIDKGGAIKVNDVAVNDEKMALSASDVNAEGVIKLSFGKKRHALLQPL